MHKVTVTGSTGANATYARLELAFTAINGTVQTDNNIIITITANTTESASAVLNAGAWTTLNIYPTVTGLSITGNLEAPLIDLNGADNVTIDGRVNATGATKDLIITNTSTAAMPGTSTIRFIDDANTNTVKYCTLKGSSTDAEGGVLFFSTTNAPNNTYTATAGKINGIAATSGTNTISNNTVSDLTIANRNTAKDATASVIGIVQTSTTPAAQTVSGNTIYNLSNTNSSFGGGVIGIYYAGPATASTVSCNFIHSLSISSATNGSGVYGMYINGGTTTYSNNIIRLGDNTAINVYGIQESNGTNNYYFNTVYIGGSPTTGGFSSIGANSQSNATRNFMNNLFINARSNNGGATGTHYGAAFNTTSLTIDYNDYIASGTGGVLGFFGAFCTTLAEIKAAYQNAHSLNTDPLFHSLTNLHVMPSSPVINAGTFIATITTDYDGTTRNATTPTIGAYEQTFNTVTSSGTVHNPPASESELIPLTVAGGVTFTPTTALTGNVNGYYFTAGRTGSAPAGIVDISPYFWALSTDITSINTGIKFYFDNIPSNGITDYTTIKLLRRDGPGSNWTEYSGYTNFSTYIQANGATGFSEWAIGGSEDNPLPVELASFTSDVNGRNVKLNWITSSEQNNAGFDVERKTVTGIWSKVGFLQGKGTANTPSNYSFEDKNLNTGKYNYRLKQIDVNGNFSFHNLNTVLEVGLPAKFDLSQNYPNPFNPVTKIDYQLPSDGKVSIRIYDITGREVKTLMNNVQRTAGYYTLDFNGSSFASGIYFYRFIAESAGKQTVISKRMTLIK